jgi:hypothetical protein
MANKNQIHEKLVGRRVVEDVAWISTVGADMNNRTLKYYGLTGTEAEIVAVYLDQSAVKAIIVGDNGRMADVYVTLFLLKPEAKNDPANFLAAVQQ